MIQNMIYASNHGPKEQTHVPMMLWMSQGFVDEHKINRGSLEVKSSQALSHDNLFHSIFRNARH